MRELRFLKRNARSRRKSSRRGWFVVSGQPRAPRHAAGSGPLLALPSGSMQQRTIELPKLPPRTAFPTMRTPEVQQAAQRVTGSASGPAYRVATDRPLFRDETTLEEYEDWRLARLRELQRFGKEWSDGTGVVHGSGQSPKTITWSTTDYREFAGDGGRKAGSR